MSHRQLGQGRIETISSIFLPSRRGWFHFLIGSLIAPKFAHAADALDPIRDKGRAAGLDPFEVVESEHYRGIGDAHPKFQKEALAISEAVAADYRRHFAEKGFELTKPAEKLTVVILASPQSYAAFEKCMVDEAIGGHFDLETNQLVTFDSRLKAQRPGVGLAVSELDNTLQLVHETIHQLTFNSGVLDLGKDVPKCVSEGLATYGETWGPRRRGVIGSRNERRLQGLRDSLKGDSGWIPLSALLADDRAFEEKATEQIAYAESWLFVSKQMREAGRLPRFRAYLRALREKSDPKKRVELATTHLGDLDKLDRDMRR